MAKGLRPRIKADPRNILPDLTNPPRFAIWKPRAAVIVKGSHLGGARVGGNAFEGAIDGNARAGLGVGRRKEGKSSRSKKGKGPRKKGRPK